MGLIVDTNVLIKAEKGQWGAGLLRLRDSNEEAGIAAISLSELMMGVHLADSPERAERRTSFIEGLLAWLVVFPFGRPAAERHAVLRAGLRRKGLTVGPHDLLIAATASAMDWRVLTHNAAEFALIDGLSIEPA